MWFCFHMILWKKTNKKGEHSNWSREKNTELSFTFLFEGQGLWYVLSHSIFIKSNENDSMFYKSKGTLTLHHSTQSFNTISLWEHLTNKEWELLLNKDKFTELSSTYRIFNWPVWEFPGITEMLQVVDITEEFMF